jgi:ABC-2 type transport system permease protein
VILPALTMTLRLRMLTTVLSSVGVVVVILIVGALFPAVGGSIGKLDLPKGVTTLLGGADYATLTGWMRSEIGAVYGPLLLAYTGISIGAGSTAGEEEAGILALTLAYPITRTRFVLAKAAAVLIGVACVAVATFVGLVVGVAIGGGGISLANIAAVALHLAFFGWAAGTLAITLGASTGRRALASGGAAAFVLLGFLVNGFAPLVDALAWLRYTSLFYYYEGHDPIANGIDASDLAVLAVATLAFIALAVLGIRHRDLRK